MGYDPIKDLGVDPAGFLQNKLQGMQKHIDTFNTPSASEVGAFQLGQNNASAQTGAGSMASPNNIGPTPLSVGPSGFPQQGAVPPQQPSSQQQPMQAPQTQQAPQAPGQFGVVPTTVTSDSPIAGQGPTESLAVLGQKVKAKYPGKYDDISDDKLGSKVLAKYPNYKDIVDQATADNEVKQNETIQGDVIGGLNRSAQGTAEGFEQAGNWLGSQIVEMIGKAQGKNDEEIKAMTDKGWQASDEYGVQDMVHQFSKMVGENPDSIVSKATKTVGDISQIADAGLAGWDALKSTSLVPATMKIGSSAEKAPALIEDVAAISGTTPKAVVQDAKSSQTWEAISPKMNAAEKADRAANATKVNGKVVYAPKKSEIPLISTAHEVGIVNNVDRIVNYQKADQAITKEANNLLTVVKDNPVTFTPQEVGARLNKIEMPPLVKSDPTLKGAYNLAKQRFMEILKKQPKMNAEGMLKARQEFDTWVSKSYPNLYSNESWSPLKSAIVDIRSTANDMLADKIGGDVVKTSLKKQSQLYTIRDNIATDLPNAGETNRDRFQKNNPTTASVIQSTGKKILPGLGIGLGVAGGTAAIDHFTNQ